MPTRDAVIVHRRPIRVEELGSEFRSQIAFIELTDKQLQHRQEHLIQLQAVCVHNFAHTQPEEAQSQLEIVCQEVDGSDYQFVASWSLGVHCTWCGLKGNASSLRLCPICLSGMQTVMLKGRDDIAAQQTAIGRFMRQHLNALAWRPSRHPLYIHQCPTCQIFTISLGQKGDEHYSDH